MRSASLRGTNRKEIGYERMPWRITNRAIRPRHIYPSILPLPHEGKMKPPRVALINVSPSLGLSKRNPSEVPTIRALAMVHDAEKRARRRRLGKLLHRDS